MSGGEILSLCAILFGVLCVLPTLIFWEQTKRTVLCIFSFAMTALMVCIPTACDYIERNTEFSDRTMALTGILAFLFLGFWAGFPHAKRGD